MEAFVSLGTEEEEREFTWWGRLGAGALRGAREKPAVHKIRVWVSAVLV